MMAGTKGFILGGVGLWSAVFGYIHVAQERAEHWNSILSRSLVETGSPPLEGMRSVPGKGCGWSFGETAWGWTTMADQRTKVLLCRNRAGVRIDVTTYESRWIRGPKSLATGDTNVRDSIV